MITHWPITPIQLGARRYDLCFNLGAVARAQQEFDGRGIDVNLLEAIPVLNLTNVRILFRHGISKCHPELDYVAARQLVTWEGVYAIAGALRAAWQAASPEPVPVEERKARLEKPAKPLSKDGQWQRLWSLAVYDLRLTTSEFYGLTLGQLDALIRRHERAIQEREFLFGQLASTYVNFSMAHPKEPVRPRDFMPSEWAREAIVEKPKRRRPRQLIATEIRGVMETFMRERN